MRKPEHTRLKRHYKKGPKPVLGHWWDMYIWSWYQVENWHPRSKLPATRMRFRQGDALHYAIYFRGKYRFDGGEWRSLHRLRREGFVLDAIGVPVGHSWEWRDAKLAPHVPYRPFSAHRFLRTCTKSKRKRITARMREAQRLSFAYGNCAIDNPAVTREVVVAAAEYERCPNPTSD